MLTPEQITFARTTLQNAKTPLFIHDDDADGLCSFLVLYHINHEGRNFIPKGSRRLDASHAQTIKQYHPDAIFILDLPEVEQEFLDAFSCPIIWMDHHEPKIRSKVTYINPRLIDNAAYYPTTAMAYEISQDPKYLWIATAGALADYYLPPYIKEFSKMYPQFLKKQTTLPKILFTSETGLLVKFFFFILKGQTQDVRDALKVLMKIKEPSEIFEESTPQGKFLHRRFTGINEKYNEILQDVLKQVTRSPILYYEYSDSKWSFTTNLANELTVRFPKKVIIITRKKDDEMKASLRAQFAIEPLIQLAMQNVQGHAGGHPNACGAVIKIESWPLFMNQFKSNIKLVKEKKKNLLNNNVLNKI